MITNLRYFHYDEKVKGQELINFYHALTENFTDAQKTVIYLHYYNTMLGIVNYPFWMYIGEDGKLNQLFALQKVPQVEFFPVFLCKNIYIKSYEEFTTKFELVHESTCSICSPIGHTLPESIYTWYWKFKDKFQHLIEGL